MQRPVGARKDHRPVYKIEVGQIRVGIWKGRYLITGGNYLDGFSLQFLDGTYPVMDGVNPDNIEYHPLDPEWAFYSQLEGL